MDAGIEKSGHRSVWGLRDRLGSSGSRWAVSASQTVPPTLEPSQTLDVV